MHLYFFDIRERLRFLNCIILIVLPVHSSALLYSLLTSASFYLVPDCMKASKVNIAINIPTPIHETSRKLEVVELEYKTMLAFSIKEECICNNWTNKTLPITNSLGAQLFCRVMVTQAF